MEVIVALLVMSAGFALSITVLSKVSMDHDVLKKISFIGRANQIMLKQESGSEQRPNMAVRENTRSELLKTVTVIYSSDSNTKNYLIKRRIVRKQ